MSNTASVTAVIVGRNIRAELVRSNRSQAWLAEQIGITQGQVSGRLSGKIPVRVDEVVAIAGYLDVPLTDLLRGVIEAPTVATAVPA